jgi:hypothetical protein
MLNIHLFHLKQAAGAKKIWQERVKSAEGLEVIGLARAIRDQMTATSEYFSCALANQPDLAAIKPSGRELHLLHPRQRVLAFQPTDAQHQPDRHI